MDDDFVYPPAKRVVMGQAPGVGGPEPLFGLGSSSSSRRMDSLYGDWREQALGVNLWWNAPDWQNNRPSRRVKILRETGCEVIVALGVFVQRELGLSPKTASPFGQETIEFEGRQILVARFPHPSGRSRFWNYAPNRVEASDVLRKVLRDT